MIGQCRDAFVSPEAWTRGRRHLLSQLLCFGRHTITGLLRHQDRTQRDWTADYRLYSQTRFAADRLFERVRVQIEQRAGPEAPLVAAMDDSLVRKTGRKIHGSQFQRDPLSPPFHLNLVRGLRVLQISAAVPQGPEGAARLIPIDFQHAALPAKPRKDAPAEVQAAYRAERAKKNINRVGCERLAQLRQAMDAHGSPARRLIVSLDGRFTNATVLRHIPERTTLIGRVRKDAAFYEAPIAAHQKKGRKPTYGARCPTPEQLLKEESQPWQTVRAYAAGKRYEFRVKTLARVFSKMNKGQHPLRLVAVEPVAYRKTKASKLERRQPAFLLCTDPDLSLEQLLQMYLWRWDIEVNFRDEKTILGVGQAQVRTEAATQNAPALAVAAYALLLLASVHVYGTEGAPQSLPQPRWYRRQPQQRATTNQLVNQLRYEMWGAALHRSFPPLCSREAPDQSGLKCDFPLNSALFLSVK